MLTDVKFEDKAFRFEVRDEKDLIQSALLHGEFFDAEWLADLRKFIPRNASILDVGANVGNHSIFFAGVCAAKRVTPFELNPLAMEMLTKNVLLNGLSNIDVSFLGTGCSSRRGKVSFKGSEVEHNLGATAFAPAADADAGPGRDVDAIDNMIPEEKVDLIKIDVEGMELEVLLGSEKLVSKYNPLLYLEVWGENPNLMALFDWLVRNNYEILRLHGPNILCQYRSDNQSIRTDVGAFEEGGTDESRLVSAASRGFVILSMFFALQSGLLETYGKLSQEYNKPDASCGNRPALEKLETLHSVRVGAPVGSAMVKSIVSAATLSDDLYRNELIRLLQDRMQTPPAVGLALAGLDRNPCDPYCLHVKSIFLEGAGLMQEALQCAEKAYQYAITEKVALGIRLADLLRTTGGSLDRAFSLTENIPPSSLLASWGDSVRAAIVDAASVAGASQASP